MGLLPQPQAARLTPARCVPRRDRLEPRGRFPYFRRAAPPRSDRGGIPLSAPTSATPRSPTTISPASCCSGRSHRTLAGQPLRYTYRLLWSPGTLGPLCWLARNLETLDRVQHGLAISCVGDPGPLRYKRSRRGAEPVDRAAAEILAGKPGSIVTDWEPLGGDERQYCSPGFNLPVGTLTRTPHGLFPEYHSSADNLGLVSSDALGSAFRATLEIIDAVETNGFYRNRSPCGEPQLGRRGLYQTVPDGTNPEAALLWVLNLSDGDHDLLSIAARSGLGYRAVLAAAEALEQHALLERLP